MQLRNPCFEVRFKALKVAEELLAQPKNVVQCIDAGVCMVFAELLQVLGARFCAMTGCVTLCRGEAHERGRPAAG